VIIAFSKLSDHFDDPANHLANVDWALLNFMQDWFPIEAREKLKASEKEALAEELASYGIDPNYRCVIM
jgi:hypothetical protein